MNVLSAHRMCCHTSGKTTGSISVKAFPKRQYFIYEAWEAAKTGLTGATSGRPFAGNLHEGVLVPSVLLQVTIHNTTFEGNSALDGGALFIDRNTTVIIDNSSFRANHASKSGGGMLLRNNSAVTATGCALHMNNARWGGGLYCNGCSFQASRLSFTRNKAVTYGGGLDAYQAQVISRPSNV